jgi:peptide/nickel transport system ATP-binding protein
MHMGRFVEVGEADVVLREPAHPYTRLLLSTVTPDRRALIGDDTDPLVAQAANGAGPSHGCPFADRCPDRMPQCDSLVAELRSVGNGHWVACHRC